MAHCGRRGVRYFGAMLPPTQPWSLRAEMPSPVPPLPQPPPPPYDPVPPQPIPAPSGPSPTPGPDVPIDPVPPSIIDVVRADLRIGDWALHRARFGQWDELGVTVHGLEATVAPVFLGLFDAVA